VFIAGQYASGPDGQVTSPNFADQVERSFVNLGTALEAQGVGFEDVVRLGTFIVAMTPTSCRSSGRYYTGSGVGAAEPDAVGGRRTRTAGDAVRGRRDRGAALKCG
jgi:enamine deaminase RidA (YjgF/YER057c/UK114 family)